MSQRHRRSADPVTGPAGRVGSETRWWALAAVLLLLATGLVAFQSLQSAGEPRGSLAGAAEPKTPPGPAGAPAQDRSATALTESVPVQAAPAMLRIPAIGLEESLITLGLNEDDTVEVPTDFSRAGWYRHGPSPGEEGSAVILGHVDSFTGPAVFYRLHELSPEDVIEVDLADGGIAHFAVTAVEDYAKTEFPAEAVYGSNGGSSLQLVTCGGVFDPTAASYLSNVVVYTSLVGITAPEGLP